MTRPGLEPAPPASEANALTITLSGPVILSLFLVRLRTNQNLATELDLAIDLVAKRSFKIVYISYISLFFFTTIIFPLLIFKLSSPFSSVECLSTRSSLTRVFSGCLTHNSPGGRGGGGYSHFLWIHRRGPSFCPQTQKITEIY